MKKKLLALVLCLVMLISAAASLSACSKKEDKSEGTEVKNDGAKTITMWVVTENEKNSTDENGNPCFSPEVQQAMDKVEQAFSKVTKSDFKTNVDIRFLTAEEYYGKLEEAISYSADKESNIERAKRALKYYIKLMNEKIENNEIISMDEDEITEQFYIDYPEYWEYREGGKYLTDSNTQTSEEDEYIVNDLGVREIKYPEAEDNQVDIFYISGDGIWKDEDDETFVSGYDRYVSYIEKGWLAELDENLNGVGANIKSYISPAILNGVKYSGLTYAIPNNSVIGEYTYMLIDKETYDDFGYGGGFDSSITLLDCEKYLADIAGGDTGLVPIDSTFEETMSHFVWFWSVSRQEGDTGITYPYNKNGDTFSIFGSLYNAPLNNGRGNIELGFNNLMADTDFTKILSTLKSYDINGYFGDCEDGQNRAAISYLTGDYGIKRVAEENDGVYEIDGKEYYVTIVKYPEIQENDLYGNMFAVCSASKNSYACMEVLAALNTDSELRNILQYGVVANPNMYEKGHYKIDDETGVLTRVPLNDAGEYYSMDIKKTGNCFVAHPEEGYPEDYWNDMKKQNGEAIVDPLLGFDLTKELKKTGFESFSSNELKVIANRTESVYNAISGAKTVEDLEKIISEMSAWAGDSYKDSNFVTVDMDKYANPKYEPDGDTHSMYTVYYNWLKDNGYVPAATDAQ